MGKEKKQTNAKAANTKDKNKKAVVSGGKKKKKRNWCCNCLIVMLITFVILIGGAFAAAWFTGDYFAKQYIDMSLGDVLGAINDIKSGKAPEIKSYSADDVTSFENEIKEQLFLKSGVDIPYETLSDMIFGALGGNAADAVRETGSGDLKIRNTLLMEVMRDHGTVSNAAEEATADDPMAALLANILKRENIDTDALKAYAGEARYLTIEDKQLAAFLTKVLDLGITQLDSSSDLDDSNSIFSISSILKKIDIGQVRISGTNETPVMRLTGVVDVRAFAIDVLADQGIANIDWAVNMVLPKNIYVSADVGLGETPTIALQINNMDQNKMARLYKLINGVMDMMTANSRTGQFLKQAERDALTDFEKFDVEGIISGIAAESVAPITKELKAYADFSEAAQGKIKADIFGTLISFAQLNIDSETGEPKPENEQLSASDIVYTLKYLLASEPEVNTEATYQNQYQKNGTDEVYYQPVDFTDTSKYTLVDYKKEFLKEISAKYLIKVDLDDVDGEFERISSLFGIGEAASGDTSDFIDKIDASGEKIVALARNPEALNKLILTDRMLGALFGEFLGTFMGEGGAMGDLNPAISSIVLKKTGEAGAKHNWIEAAFTVNISGIMGSDNAFAGMLDNLIGGEIMLAVELDITPAKKLGETDDYGAGKIKYNNLTYAETDHFIRTVAKLAPGTDFTAEGLLGQIEPSFRDVINSMYDLMPGIDMGESRRIDDRYDESLFEAGSLFSLIADQINPEDGGETTDESEIRGLVLAFWDVDGDAVVGRRAHESETKFMQEFSDKFYMKEAVADFDALLDMTNTQGQREPDSGFSYAKLNITDNSDPDRPSMAYDSRDTEDLRVFLEDRDFAAILAKELDKREGSQGNAALSGFTKIAGVSLDPDFNSQKAVEGTVPGTGISPDGKISIVISVDKESLLGVSGDAKYLKVLPEEFFFTLMFDVSESGTVEVEKQNPQDPGGAPVVDYRYYTSSVKINNMVQGGTDYNNMMKIMRLMNKGAEPFDVSELQNEIGRMLYERINDLKENLGENNLVFEAREAAAAEPDGDGLEYGFNLGSFYHFLAASDKTGGLTADTLRSALQGMYEFDPACPDNPNNYKEENIIHTPVGQMPVVNLPFFDVSDSGFGAMLKDGSSLGLGAGNPFADQRYALVQFESVSTGADTAQITITFEARITVGSDFVGDSNQGYHGLMSDSMFFTFLVDWDKNAAGDKYTLRQEGGRDFIINDLSAADQVQLFQMTGYNTSLLNDKIVGSGGCMQILNSSLSLVSYGEHRVFIAAPVIPPINPFSDTVLRV